MPVAQAKQVVRAVRRRRQSSRRWLERFFEAAHDPYHSDHNAYEMGKFEDILGVLDDRRFGRALEVGCAIGSFTELLAPRCDDLLAIDIAGPAVERTRVRVAHLPQVRVEQRSASALPDGPFDLVVCSDVLYFLPVRALRRRLRELEALLAPGGTIVSLHWLGDFGAPTSGDTVHDEQERLWTRLDHVRSHSRVGIGPEGAGYRLDRYDRPA